MLSVVVTDLGRPLPGRLSVVPWASFFWMSRSRLALGHPSCRNSFIRRRELQDVWSRNVFITTLHWNVILMYRFVRLNLYFNFRSKFFRVQCTHWTLLFGCIHTSCPPRGLQMGAHAFQIMIVLYIQQKSFSRINIFILCSRAFIYSLSSCRDRSLHIIWSISASSVSTSPSHLVRC